MVNPERQHNALAALDVLGNVARADAMTSEEWSRIERKRHMGFALTPEEEKAWADWEARVVPFDDARNDAADPKTLSDDALRLKVGILESDLREAARSPGANASALRSQLDAYEAELRRRQPRNDAGAVNWQGSYVSKDGTTKSITVMALNEAGAARLIANQRDFASAVAAPVQK